MKLRTSTSHEEGANRDFSVTTKKFTGSNSVVNKMEIVKVDWKTDSNGKMKMNELGATSDNIPADLVLLAMGFVHPIHDGILNDLSIELDNRGNVKANTNNYKTSNDKVFVAGDMRRGQSLVVWAIREGRQCARSVDKFLMGETNLPN
tara:strand:- start:449 stop:892 length:444 start_codon:yes stop_codon:yes gene_type:complete